MNDKKTNIEANGMMVFLTENSSGKLDYTEPKVGASERCYIDLSMPSLPKNPRIKNAKIILTQKSTVGSIETFGGFCLYAANAPVGYDMIPPSEGELLDYKTVKVGDEEHIVYTFDITKMIDMYLAGEQSYLSLVLKGKNENSQAESYCTFYTPNESEFDSCFTVIYDTDYAVNTAYCTHSLDFGRYGRGGVDLLKGNLMLELDAYSWGGNRMPVTIKWLYNSVLADSQFTCNYTDRLYTADFSPMKLGYGWRLNLMQSMIFSDFMMDGAVYDGYIRMDEMGDETYFIPSDETGIYVMAGDEKIKYNSVTSILDLGNEKHHFDTVGRLVKIVDEYENEMNIMYTNERLSKVTDGIGRVFSFGYDMEGRLLSVMDPDGYFYDFSYLGDQLLGITSPDQCACVMYYTEDKLTEIKFLDMNGSDYKVSLDYNGDRVQTVTEYGGNDGEMVQGISTMANSVRFIVLLDFRKTATN